MRFNFRLVTPAQAGVQFKDAWIPACAGMTILLQPIFRHGHDTGCDHIPGVQPGARIIITGTQTERRIRSATLPITQRLTPDRP